MVMTPFAGWQQKGESWSYEQPDQSAVKDQWYQSDLNWYHFDKDGRMQTGWFQDADGKKYYLSPEKGKEEGAMKTGWFLDKDGAWYWLNPASDGTRGSILYGWQWIEGKCYYLQSNGACLMSGVSPDGYTVNESGAWTVNGVVQVRAAAKTLSGGSSSSGSNSNSGNTNPIIPVPVYDSVYVGSSTELTGWTKDTATGIYHVVPGTYQNVHVTAAVGDGEVVVDGALIKGDLYINGGGSNSIKLKGSTSVEGKAVMNKATGGQKQAGNAGEVPRLELNDSVRLARLDIEQPAVIEAVSPTAGFTSVTARAKTVIRGSATTVELLQVNTSDAINISNASVTSARVNAETANLSGTGTAGIGTVETNWTPAGGAAGTLKLQDLRVDKVAVTKAATVEIKGDMAIGEILVDAAASVKSGDGQTARVSKISATADVELGDIVVNQLTVDRAISVSSIAGSTGAAVVSVEANADVTLNLAATVGTVVVNNPGFTIHIGKDTTVNTVEAKAAVTVSGTDSGTGSVGMIVAESETEISGEFAGMKTEVKFISAYSLEERTAAYGAELPADLPDKYVIPGASEETAKAAISWEPYTFTSRQPGTYTVYGSWTTLPDGYMAGGVRPSVQIIVEPPATSRLTFKDVNGLTGFDVSLTSEDGGEVFSFADGTAVVWSGKKYSYTAGKAGYTVLTGQLDAVNGDQTISLTFEKAENPYQLTFTVPEDAGQYLKDPLPKSNNYVAGTKMILPTSHTKAGYQLIWKKGENEISVPEFVVTEAAAYTASWKIIDYKISYVGAELSEPTASYTVDTADVTLPSPAAEAGTIFDGWYSNSSFAGQRITKIAKGSVGDKAFYAKWLTELSVTDRVPVTKDIISTKSLDNCYFAEGKNVLISVYDNGNEIDGLKLLVTIGGKQYLAKEDINVFAGSYASTEDVTCKGGSIMLQSGKVNNLFGGGAGTADQWEGHSANTTDSVSIRVNGGDVTRIYGGGTGLATVEKVAIDVNGTDEGIVIQDIYGGGAAPGGSIQNNLDQTTHISKNDVKEAVIHVGEGVEALTLQGGGISIASVEKTAIRLDGTIKARMIGGGTNGYTGDVTVVFGPTAVLEAGNAYGDDGDTYLGKTIYQTGFRGIVGDVSIEAEQGAAFGGDIYLGTNCLKDDGQNAAIIGSMMITFAADPMQTDGPENSEKAGIIYVGAGEKGASLDGAKSITIAGPVAISPYAYSQDFGTKDETMLKDEVKKLVTLSEGAYWDIGFAGGSGTEEDPYLISTAAELENISTICKAESPESYDYKLTADIDFSELSEESKKAGYVTKYFAGVLDGNGNKFLADPEKDMVFANRTYGAEFNNLELVQDNHYINLNWFVCGNVTFSKVNVTNAEGTTFVTTGQNESSFCSNVLADDVTVTFDGCTNEASYTYQSGLYGGVFFGGFGKQDTTYVFKECTNTGTVYGKEVALFIGNSTNAVPVNQITVENCTNDGKLLGTVFAGLFNSIGGNQGYKEANEQFGKTVGGTGGTQIISVTGVTAVASGQAITITNSDETEPLYEYEYELNVVAPYSYDGGTSWVTMTFDAVEGENSDLPVAWILDADTAETYGITADEGNWQKTEINQIEISYQIVTTEDASYYVISTDGLDVGSTIKSKGEFRIDVYADVDGMRILLGTVPVNTAGITYPELKKAAEIEKLPVIEDILDITDSDTLPKDDPGQATDPTEGENPGQATDPTEGENPGQATDPAEGDNPGQATDPAEGDNPGQATDPMEEENLAN